MTDPFGPDDSGTPDTIIGISFDDAFRAQEFLTALGGMQARGTLELLDAVVVTKDLDGSTRVRETVDLQPGRAALSGAVWTGLLGLIVAGPVGWIAGLGVGAGAGALTAKIVDVGVPDEWVEWFRAAVEPHTFTVVALANDVQIEPLVAETSRFEGARLVYANLPPGIVRRIEQSLGESDEGTGATPTATEPTPIDRAPAEPGPAGEWPPPTG